MNQQDEYFMIEFNEKINNGKKTTVDEKNKAISLLIWGTVIKTFEPPKKIEENKYQQMFSNGLKVEYSYSKDGKDLIIEYEFESGKKSEEQDEKDKKDNKKTEDIFEIFLFKPKEIIYTKQIYEVGEIFVNDKSWKILEKTHREDKINIKEKKILDGDYNVSIAQNRIDCKGDNCSFEIVKGWNTNNMIIGKTMIPGKTFKERSGYEGELLIEQGDILLDSIISEIKKSSKGKKIKLVVFEEKQENKIAENFKVQVIARPLDLKEGGISKVAPIKYGHWYFYFPNGNIEYTTIGKKGNYNSVGYNGSIDVYETGEGILLLEFIVNKEEFIKSVKNVENNYSGKYKIVGAGYENCQTFIKSILINYHLRINKKLSKEMHNIIFFKGVYCGFGLGVFVPATGFFINVGSVGTAFEYGRLSTNE